MLRRVQLFEIPWTVAHQAPTLSLGFPREEYWSEEPFPSLGDLPDPGIGEPGFPALEADSLLSEPPRKLKCIDLNKPQASDFKFRRFSLNYLLQEEIQTSEDFKMEAAGDEVQLVNSF